MLVNYVLAVSLITIVPGPSMIVTIKKTLDGGLRQGLLALSGVVIADAILMLITLSGLGVLIVSSPWLYSGLKLIGAAYLLYLGISEWRKQHAAIDLHPEHSSHACLQALQTTLLNPKIIVFLMAFLPPYMDPKQAIWQQILTLVPLFLLVVATILLGYVLCAQGIRQWLTQGYAQRILHHVTALTLLGCSGLAIYSGLMT